MDVSPELNNVLSSLKKEGWSLKVEEVTPWLPPSLLPAKASLLDSDLRGFGASVLPAGINSMANMLLAGPFILQVVSVEDISQPSSVSSDYGKSSTRLLRISLTDGRTTSIGVEYRPIPTISGNTPPGSKFKIFDVQVHSGILLLDSKNTSFLGGKVGPLYEAWEMERKYSSFSRSGPLLGENSGVDSQPPPFRGVQSGKTKKKTEPDTETETKTKNEVEAKSETRTKTGPLTEYGTKTETKTKAEIQKITQTEKEISRKEVFSESSGEHGIPGQGLDMEGGRGRGIGIGIGNVPEERLPPKERERVRAGSQPYVPRRRELGLQEKTSQNPSETPNLVKEIEQIIPSDQRGILPNQPKILPDKQNVFSANPNTFSANQNNFSANQNTFSAIQNTSFANQNTLSANQNKFSANQNAFSGKQTIPSANIFQGVPNFPEPAVGAKVLKVESSSTSYESFAGKKDFGAVNLSKPEKILKGKEMLKPTEMSEEKGIGHEKKETIKEIAKETEREKKTFGDTKISVAENVPVHNRQAAQKLLERKSEEERGRGRGRGGRGQRERRRGGHGGEDGEDEGMTLDEWEAMKKAGRGGGVLGGGGREAKGDYLSDEALARQLQNQMDMEDFKQVGGVGGSAGEDLRQSMFSFSNGGVEGEEEAYGSGGGRGRGRRGGGRRGGGSRGRGRRGMGY